MRKTVIAFLAVVMMATVSCKKDKDDDSAVTKENLAGTYKLGSFKMQIGTSPEQDVTSSYVEVCELDNTTTLKTDLTYAIADVGTVCSPSSSETGTWSLPNATSFELDGDTYTIKSWNGKQLVLTQSDNSSGINILLTMTINKQ